MSIKKDALELLIKLYNDKVDGIEFDIDRIYNFLGFSETRFMNAYDYLVDRGLIHKGTSFIGKSVSGLPNIGLVYISSSGVDTIEKEEILKDKFGTVEINFNQQGKVNIISQSGDKSPVNIKAPYVENPTYQNVGEVTYGDKIQNVTDGSITYEGDKRNVFIIKNLSILFINKFGERKVKITGIILSIIGVIDFAIGLFSYINNWFPRIINDFSIPLIVVGFILLIIGVFFLSLVLFKHESKCPKCKKEYAMEESKDPKVKEVKASDGIHQITTRFVKCKYCGFKDTIIGKKLIPYEENE